MRLRASTFRSAQLQRDLARLGSQSLADLRSDAPERLRAAASRRDYAAAVGGWLRWFVRTLIGSIYPGAPCERSLLALELYSVFVDGWGGGAGARGGRRQRAF